MVNELEGVQHIKNGETVRIWHQVIRENNECFPNPQVVRRGTGPRLPPMLENNPDVKDGLLKYAKENINDLSAELCLTYLHEVAIPTLVEKRKEELEDDSITVDDILKENRLTKLSLSTVYRWLE